MQLIGKPFKREQFARKVAEAMGTATIAVAEPGNVVVLRSRQ